MTRSARISVWQRFPERVQIGILSWLDPKSVLVVERTAKCFKNQLGANESIYKAIRLRFTDVDQLPGTWTEKDFLYFAMKRPERQSHPMSICHCSMPEASNSYALLKTTCCERCFDDRILDWPRAIKQLEDLEPGIPRATVDFLLRLIPYQLRPNLKVWRLKGCRFASRDVADVYQRFRASNLSLQEFAKQQTPVVLEVALLKQIEDSVRKNDLLKDAKADIEKSTLLARTMQYNKLFDELKLSEDLRPVIAPYVKSRPGPAKLLSPAELKREGRSLEQDLKRELTREAARKVLLKADEEMFDLWNEVVEEAFGDTRALIAKRLLLKTSIDLAKPESFKHKRLQAEVDSICLVRALGMLTDELRCRGDNASSTPCTALNLEAYVANLKHYQDSLPLDKPRFQIRCRTLECQSKPIFFSTISAISDHIKYHLEQGLSTTRFAYNDQVNQKLRYQMRELRHHKYEPILDADSPLLSVDSIRALANAGEESVSHESDIEPEGGGDLLSRMFFGIPAARLGGLEDDEHDDESGSDMSLY